jgi:Gamma tubulin complex component N-terminal
LFELFKSLLEPYEKILSVWTESGELLDPYNEFFIKPNSKKIAAFKSSTEQWQKSFVFRSADIHELLDKFGAEIPFG